METPGLTIPSEDKIEGVLSKAATLARQDFCAKTTTTSLKDPREAPKITNCHIVKEGLPK